MWQTPARRTYTARRHRARLHVRIPSRGKNWDIVISSSSTGRNFVKSLVNGTNKYKQISTFIHLVQCLNKTEWVASFATCHFSTVQPWCWRTSCSAFDLLPVSGPSCIACYIHCSTLVDWNLLATIFYLRRAVPIIQSSYKQRTDFLWSAHVRCVALGVIVL